VGPGGYVPWPREDTQRVPRSHRPDLLAPLLARAGGPAGRHAV